MNALAGENHKTILLCDDNLMNRTLIFAILDGAPYRIIESSCGLDCINAALDTRNRVDLVLLDIGLKDINGVQVCQDIRAGLNDPIARLPIIAYTAHAMEEERKHYLENGFSDILIKPIIKNDLLSILTKHIV